MTKFEELGVKRVINGSFCYTVLGSSILAKEIIDASIDANKYFVDMTDLEEKAGKIISQETRAEAAHITAGAFSALVLSAAACITGMDLNKMKKLPDTRGMKNEIIIQKNLRISFDRAMEIPGGKLVVIEPNADALSRAINEKTAAVHFLPKLDPLRTDVVPLEDIIEIGHRNNVPIIVDAAGQTYPTERLRTFVEKGADLVCYSGKYIYGPNSTGFVCGKKNLIDAVIANSFIGPETGWIGRGYKLDRQEIIAIVTALKRWMRMDHEKERFQPAYRKRIYLIDALKEIPEITLTSLPYLYHSVGLQITFNKLSSEETSKLVDMLRSGNPSIWVKRNENNIIINTLFLLDGDENVIAGRLRQLFS